MTVPAIGSRHVPRPRAGAGEQPVTVRQLHRPDRSATVELDDGTKAVVKLAELRRKWKPEPLSLAALEPEPGELVEPLPPPGPADEARRLADLEAELKRRNPSHPPALARAQAEAMADAVRMARRLTLAQRDALYRIGNGGSAGYSITVIRPLVALRLAFARPSGELELTAAGGDVLRALEHGA